jgi:hypothetical protein
MMRWARNSRHTDPMSDTTADVEGRKAPRNGWQRLVAGAEGIRTACRLCVPSIQGTLVSQGEFSAVVPKKPHREVSPTRPISPAVPKRGTRVELLCRQGWWRDGTPPFSLRGRPFQPLPTTETVDFLIERCNSPLARGFSRSPGGEREGCGTLENQFRPPPRASLQHQSITPHTWVNWGFWVQFNMALFPVERAG